ncbi:PBSX family phage terminase large subunit [Bacteroidia bacterium]|nr:PBSX family phage terminase large subunit [Bacteroidia bacterium]
MDLTRTFSGILDAYNSGYRYIISRGGTRSGKTFAELQLIFFIANKAKPRIITTVSQTLPQLKDGAIRDYDNILMSSGVVPDNVRIKNPYIYKHGNNIHEFRSFDNMGNALGASRDILFINEGNRMKWETVHQLMTRTRETIFIDFNPSNHFWVEEIEKRPDAITLTSTFRDNAQNLTEAQLNEFVIAKQKADAEAARGVYGYWSNWWRVYACGEYGKIEGAIYTDWEIGKFDETLPYRFGLDFGYFPDPDALVKFSVNEKTKTIFLKEEFHKNNQSEDDLIALLKIKCGNHLILADSAEKRLINDLKQKGRLNIVPTVKWLIIERIRKMQSYHLVIDPESYNLINEIENYIWLDKKSGTPPDKANHLLDAAGYALTGQSSSGIRKISFKN